MCVIYVREWFQYVGYDCTACMDYMDPNVRCPQMAVKLARSLTPLHSTPLHSTPLHSTPLHSTPLHSLTHSLTHPPTHSLTHSYLTTTPTPPLPQEINFGF